MVASRAQVNRTHCIDSDGWGSAPSIQVKSTCYSIFLPLRIFTAQLTRTKTQYLFLLFVCVSCSLFYSSGIARDYSVPFPSLFPVFWLALFDFHSYGGVKTMVFCFVGAKLVPVCDSSCVGLAQGMPFFRRFHFNAGESQVSPSTGET